MALTFAFQRPALALGRSALLLCPLLLAACSGSSSSGPEALPNVKLSLKALRSAVPKAPNVLNSDQPCVIRGPDSKQSFMVEVTVSAFELTAPGLCSNTTAAPCGSLAVRLYDAAGKLAQQTVSNRDLVFVPTDDLEEGTYGLKVALVSTTNPYTDWTQPDGTKAKCSNCEAELEIASVCGDLSSDQFLADAGLPSLDAGGPDSGATALLDASAMADSASSVEPADSAAPNAGERDAGFVPRGADASQNVSDAASSSQLDASALQDAASAPDASASASGGDAASSRVDASMLDGAVNPDSGQ